LKIPAARKTRKIREMISMYRYEKRQRISGMCVVGNKQNRTMYKKTSEQKRANFRFID
jgi:hypothetical protein